MPSAWSLPARPDAPEYVEILGEIAATKEAGERRRRFRELLEADYWAFVRFGLSFGKYLVDDKRHPFYGRPWAEHPWVFERCRELQADVEADADDVFYNWSRFFFKTALVTVGLTCWETLKNPQLTTAIITHKVEQAGSAMFLAVQSEFTENVTLIDTWPKVLRRDRGEYPLCKNTAMTLIRPLGPKEPTVSIHSIDHLPTSGHFNRLVVDDAVVDKTVESVTAMERTERQLRRLTAIGKDSTITRHVGTIWDSDDPNMKLLKAGIFSRRSYQPGLQAPDSRPWAQAERTEDWTPVLRSREFVTGWRRKLGEYEFSCQIMGQPTARHEQAFQPQWRLEYDGRPRDERKGKRVHIFIDPAGVEPKANDYWCFRVIAIGDDGHRYNLDMWREHCHLNDALDLLFALVRYWRPETVWLEEYTASSYQSTIRREMGERHFRFTLRRLPPIKRAKTARILVLQRAYERGEHWNPAQGFGHGSGPYYIDALRAAAKDPRIENQDHRARVDDPRDTYVQFVQEEYSRWTPRDGSVLNDDMLDCEAWPAQEEVRMLLPKPEEVSLEPDYNTRTINAAKDAEVGFAAVSGWAY